MSGGCARRIASNCWRNSRSVSAVATRWSPFSATHRPRYFEPSVRSHSYSVLRSMSRLWTRVTTGGARTARSCVTTGSLRMRMGAASRRERAGDNCSVSMDLRMALRKGRTSGSGNADSSIVVEARETREDCSRRLDGDMSFSRARDLVRDSSKNAKSTEVTPPSGDVSLLQASIKGRVGSCSIWYSNCDLARSPYRAEKGLDRDAAWTLARLWIGDCRNEGLSVVANIV